MRRRAGSQEEELARKLVLFVGQVLFLLCVAAIAFIVASRPPRRDSAAEGSEGPAAPALESARVEAFRDRLAQVRLGTWPLAKRKEEASGLLRSAPTEALRQEVKNLLADLAREERYEKLAALQALRRNVSTLIAQHRFEAAGKLLRGFELDHPQFKSEIDQLRNSLSRRKQRAFLQLADQAETAIAAGDVPKVAELAEEALAFAPPDMKDMVSTWVPRAEDRHRRLATATPKATPQSTPPNSASPRQPEEAQPAAEKPAAEAPKPFAALVTVLKDRTVRTPEGKRYSLELEEAEILLDTVLTAGEFSQSVRRGTGLWIFGRPRVRTGLLRPFGKTIARTIDQPQLAFLAESFFPEVGGASATSKEPGWLFGKVQLAYPVLRITLQEGHTYLVQSQEVPVVRRKKLTLLPSLTPGAVLAVEGTCLATALRAQRLVVLAESLAENPLYRACCLR